MAGKYDPDGRETRPSAMATLECKIANYIHIIITGNATIPQADHCIVHLIDISEWAMIEIDNISMAEVNIRNIQIHTSPYSCDVS